MTIDLARDIAAAVNVILGVAVAILELRRWQRCKRDGRWVILVKAAAGAVWAVISALAILGLYATGDIIDPLIGRPATSLLLAALAVGAIYDHRRGC